MRDFDGAGVIDRRGRRTGQPGAAARSAPRREASRRVVSVAALLLGAGLLAGCGGGGDGLFGFLFGGDEDKARTQTAQTAQTAGSKSDPPAAAAAAPAKAPPTPQYPACKTVRKPEMIAFNRSVHPGRLITVAAVGDVLLHDSVQKFASFQKDGFYSLIAPVADLIRAADVAFANLEGPAAAGVTKRGRAVRPPKKRYDGQVYSGYPLFNYHPSIVADLKRAGFDVLQTANNHSLDRYAVGADKTIEAIETAGLPYTGTRHRDRMSRPWSTVTPVAANGQSYNIAWLACTYGTNGIPDRANQVLHCFEQREEVRRTVARLSARPEVHAVMVTPHWGAEYRHKPTERQRDWAREMLDAGATAIIGTHPHVIQPIERYRTQDGRETLIAYSLGNFVSNQIGLPRRSSAILMMGLSADERGKLSPATVGWIPIWMRKSGGRMYAEAIDRAEGKADANLRHLLKHLPRENMLAARTDFWADRACTHLAQR